MTDKKINKQLKRRNRKIGRWETEWDNKKKKQQKEICNWESCIEKKWTVSSLIGVVNKTKQTVFTHFSKNSYFLVQVYYCFVQLLCSMTNKMYF